MFDDDARNGSDAMQHRIVSSETEDYQKDLLASRKSKKGGNSKGPSLKNSEVRSDRLMHSSVNE